MITVQTLQILLFLIPGLIASRIYDSLVVRRDMDQYHTVIEALIFSMIIYTVFSFIPGTPAVSFNATTFAINYSPMAFCALLFIAVFLPGIAAAVSFRDWPHSLIRRMRITKKTARSSVWSDSFNKYTTCITIHFKDGRRLTGWPQFFPDHPDKTYFFLTEPAWVVESKGKQKTIPLDLEGVLITPEMPIICIYFLKS